ncbi:FAD-dependent oxidoreductase [Sphingomonas koreensis]|nr:FAD-dependent oxidoreductase [Sphingomonas koreensis]
MTAGKQAMAEPDIDVLIVGAGIQGLTLAREAIRRGRRPLVVDRHAVGTGASGNSLNILHGGLRYLQSADIGRWRRSRQAQRWFLDHWPEHVAPLRCTMPLYRGALRSSAAFRAAFLADRGLSAIAEPKAPALNGRISPASAVLAQFAVPTRGLTGAAQWNELSVVRPTELLRRIADAVVADGGVVATATSVLDITIDGAGVLALTVDHAGSQVRTAREAIVCAGTATDAIVAQIDSGAPRNDRPILAFNLLFDHPFPAATALAVSEHPGRGRSYFLRAEDGLTLAGTWYLPAPEVDDTFDTAVPAREISTFAKLIGRAYPPLEGAAIAAVRAGLLPGNGPHGTKLSDRDRHLDHGPLDAASSIHSLVGTKLTTAPILSQTLADRLWGPA